MSIHFLWKGRVFDGHLWIFTYVSSITFRNTFLRFPWNSIPCNKTGPLETEGTWNQCQSHGIKWNLLWKSWKNTFTQVKRRIPLFMLGQNSNIEYWNMLSFIPPQISFSNNFTWTCSQLPFKFSRSQRNPKRKTKCYI